MNNSKSLPYLRDVINEQPFPDIRLSGIGALIGIYYMGKLETEYDDIMRHSKKMISKCLPSSITLILDIAHYRKGKEPDNVFLMSDYTSLFADTGGMSTQLTEEELCIIFVSIARAKKAVLFTHGYL